MGAARLTDGLAGGPSYADFVAAETARSTGGAKSWGANIGLAAGIFRTTCAAAGGSMQGTPWLSEGYGTVARWVQHSCPSQAVFNAQVSAGRLVTFNIVLQDDRALYPLNRNGYASGGDGSTPVLANCCTEFRYWDPVAGRPMQMNPNAGTGPNPYTLGT